MITRQWRVTSISLQKTPTIPPVLSIVLRHPPVTVPIVLVDGMLSGVQARGWACDAYLADAGIASVLLDQAGARVTAAQYIALFRSLIERLDDECFAFLSRPLKRGSYALVARSALGANGLEKAIRRIARAFRLVQDDVELEQVREDELAGLYCALRSRLWPARLFWMRCC